MFDGIRPVSRLGAATVLAALIGIGPGRASDMIVVHNNTSSIRLRRPVASGMAGFTVDPFAVLVSGSTLTGEAERPLSLETLQAMRPGADPSGGLSSARIAALDNAGRSYGIRGGLVARAFGISEMLRRHQAELDATYDFRGIVIPVGSGSLFMHPPVISEAQLAAAMPETGQAPQRNRRTFLLTLRAQLSPTLPSWRSYLLRSWTNPVPPPDDLRPHSPEEVRVWTQSVAEGWSQGEKQALEVYQSDLSRLEQDLLGMARYHVLLRAGLVEQPAAVFARRAFAGAGGKVRVAGGQ